jgi:hypothetical protein
MPLILRNLRRAASRKPDAVETGRERANARFEDLILRSAAPAARLEGWPRAPALVLRDAHLRKGFGGLLRMRASLSLEVQ